MVKVAVCDLLNRAVNDDFGLPACGYHPVVAGSTVYRSRIPYALGWRTPRHLVVRAKSVTLAKNDSLVTLRSAGLDMGYLKNLLNVRHRRIVRNRTGDRAWADCNADLG